MVWDLDCFGGRGEGEVKPPYKLKDIPEHAQRIYTPLPPPAAALVERNSALGRNGNACLPEVCFPPARATVSTVPANNHLRFRFAAKSRSLKVPSPATTP